MFSFDPLFLRISGQKDRAHPLELDEQRRMKVVTQVGAAGERADQEQLDAFLSLPNFVSKEDKTTKQIQQKAYRKWEGERQRKRERETERKKLRKRKSEKLAQRTRPWSPKPLANPPSLPLLTRQVTFQERPRKV